MPQYDLTIAIFDTIRYIVPSLQNTLCHKAMPVIRSNDAVLFTASLVGILLIYCWLVMLLVEDTECILMKLHDSHIVCIVYTMQWCSYCHPASCCCCWWWWWWVIVNDGDELMVLVGVCSISVWPGISGRSESAILRFWWWHKWHRWLVNGISLQNSKFVHLLSSVSCVT